MINLCWKCGAPIRYKQPQVQTGIKYYHATCYHEGYMDQSITQLPEVLSAQLASTANPTIHKRSKEKWLRAVNAKQT